MASDTLQIRWHGRGGQGAKTAAGMVAEVAVLAGKNAQGAPEYGAEREGAPIRAYTRISDRPIKVHDAIYYPDVVIVLDETLLEAESVDEGLADDGVLLVNTSRSPAEIRRALGLTGRKIYTINATGIALEEIGSEYGLTPERIRQLEKRALAKLRHPAFGLREEDLV